MNPDDPTVNVVVFKLASGESIVGTAPAQADDGVRKAWWQVIRERRPRARDVTAVACRYQPSAEDAIFIGRAFPGADVSHGWDRPTDPDTWDMLYELVDETIEEARAGVEPDTGQAATDPDWPFLSAAQGRWLRETAQAAAARYGWTMAMVGTQMRDKEWVLSLENLARKCHQAPEDSWPGLIEEHLAAHANNLDGSQEPQERDRFLRQVYLRLVAKDSVPWEIGYATPVVDGLVEALALDLPDAVRLLNDDDVARYGLDALRAAGRANLLREPVDHAAQEIEGAVLHLASGESMFVASKVLVLPELMRGVAGLHPPADGVIVTMPTRHHLAFHPIVDHTLVSAIWMMARYAISVERERPGPLSPQVYWWRDGTLTPLLAFDRDPTIKIMMPNELTAVMNRLCG